MGSGTMRLIASTSAVLHTHQTSALKLHRVVHGGPCCVDFHNIVISNGQYLSIRINFKQLVSALRHARWYNYDTEQRGH
eukprot:6174363-Pleurochrysis_carterae.AAC.1